MERTKSGHQSGSRILPVRNDAPEFKPIINSRRLQNSGIVHSSAAEKTYLLDSLHRRSHPQSRDEAKDHTKPNASGLSIPSPAMAGKSSQTTEPQNRRRHQQVVNSMNDMQPNQLLPLSSAKLATHWICTQCTYKNPCSTRRCPMCLASRPLHASSSLSFKKEPTTTTQAVLSAAFQQQFMRDLNINMHTRPPRPSNRRPLARDDLTLAQQLDLVPKPPPRLTDDQWNKVHIQAQERDTQSECPICCDVFGIQEQVLLSCSHSFHKVCLVNFEKFSGTRTCPICRAKEYEKRRITDGLRAYQHQCATRIQALYRGHRIRVMVQHLKDTVPPGDPQKRKEFFYRKLIKAGTRLQELMESKAHTLP